MTLEMFFEEFHTTYLFWNFPSSDKKKERGRETNEKNVPNLCPRLTQDELNGILRRLNVGSLPRS